MKNKFFGILAVERLVKRYLATFGTLDIPARDCQAILDYALQMTNRWQRLKQAQQTELCLEHGIHTGPCPGCEHQGPLMFGL